MSPLSLTGMTRARRVGSVLGLSLACLTLFGAPASPASAETPDILWKTGAFPVDSPPPAPVGRSFRVDQEGMAWIYDPATGALLRKFQLPTDSPSLSALSPDGERLFVYSRLNDRFVVARVSDGQVLHQFSPAGTQGYGYHFSPDASLFILTDAGFNGDPPVTLKVWDTYEGQLLWQKSLKSLKPVSFTPDGRSLLLSQRDGMTVLRARDGTELLNLPPLRLPIFSPDGRVLAALSGAGSLAFYRTDTWQALPIASNESYSFFRFAPDGESFAGLTGQAVKVYRSSDGAFLREIPVGDVTEFSFSPSGRHLAARNGDLLRVFRAGDGTHRLDIQREGIYQYQFSPGEEHLLVAYNLNSSHNTPCSSEILRLSDGSAVWKLVTENTYGLIAPVPTFSPDGETFSVSTSIGTSIHRLEDGRFLRFTGDGGAPAGFSADGRLLISRGGMAVAIWDVASGKAVGHIATSATANDAALSPDGALAAVGIGETHYVSLWDRPFTDFGADPKALIWDVAAGKPVAELHHEGPVNAVAFSPDGQILATAAGTMSVANEDNVADRWVWVSHRDLKDNRVRLWRAGDGSLIRAFEPDKEEIIRLAFSPDGGTLAGLTRNGSVRLMRASDGQPLWSFTRSHDERLTPEYIQFSPDGTVVSAAYTWFEIYSDRPSQSFHQIRRWKVSDGEELSPLDGDRLSPDEGTIADLEGFLNSNSMTVRDANSGQTVQTYTEGAEAVESLLFSPNSHLLAYREANLRLVVARNPNKGVEQGDVNRDGGVDVRDAVLTLSYLVGLESPTAEQKSLADLNSDEALTIQDVILILKKAAGIP